MMLKIAFTCKQNITDDIFSVVKSLYLTPYSLENRQRQQSAIRFYPDTIHHSPHPSIVLISYFPNIIDDTKY